MFAPPVYGMNTESTPLRNSTSSKQVPVEIDSSHHSDKTEEEKSQDDDLNIDRI